MIRNTIEFLASILLGYRKVRPCTKCGWIPRGDRSLARHLERQHPNRRPEQTGAST